MTFLRGDLVADETFSGMSPSYPTVVARLDNSSAPGYSWEYGPGAADHRYFVDFDRVPSWGLDDQIARYRDLQMPGPSFTMGMVLYRWHSNDTSATYGRLCAFLSDTPTLGGWNTAPRLMLEVNRNGSNAVFLSLIWADDLNVEHTLDISASQSFDLGNTRQAFLRVEIVNGVWTARGYLTDELGDVSVTSHDPETAVLVCEAPVPLEILALSGHTSMGFQSGSAGVPGFPLAYSGLVPRNFQYWHMAIPQPPCALTLEVYNDNGTTVRWSVSTGPNDPLPLLIRPEHYAAQDIDAVAGAASIGTVEVGVIDPATIAGDQDSGWMTARLAWLGLADIAGRRCRLLRYVDEATPAVVVADGPAGPVRLDESYAAYRWSIRDTREVERKIRCFDFVPRALVPGEHVEGYGQLTPPPFPFYLSEPLRPLRGVVTRADNYPSPSYIEVASGTSVYPANGRRLLLWQETYDAVNLGIGRTAVQSSGDPAVAAAWQAAAIALDVAGTRIFHPQFSFHWRALGSSDPWKVIPGTALAVSLSTADSTITEGCRVLGRIVVEDVRLNPALSTYDAGAVDLPDTDDEIEYYLMGIMPPDEHHPYPIENMSAGQFVQNVYDGLYSARDIDGAVVPTGIRYDAAALAQMTEPVRFLVTEPWEDARDMLERLIYGPTGWIPALDNDGRISPVSRIAPQDTSTLPLLTDADCEPAPAWHSGERIVNVVRMYYPRQYTVTHYDYPSVMPTFEHRQTIVSTRPIEVEYRDERSVARHGPQVVELDGGAFAALGRITVTELEEAEVKTTPVLVGRSRGYTIRSRLATANASSVVVSGYTVVPLSGLTIEDETGYQLAEVAGRELLARYALGAPTVAVRVRRAAAGALRAGSWCVLQLSWLPDYVTARRGLMALGQVVSIEDLDCAWRQVVVEVVVPPDLGS